MKRFIVFVFLFSVTIQLSAQDSLAIRFAEMINTENLYAHIDYLSSDKLLGREIGEKGHQEASNYIKNHFENISLACPSGKNHIQTLKVVKSYWGEIYIRHDDKVYRNLTDGVVYLGDQNLPYDSTLQVEFISNVDWENERKNKVATYYNTPYWISIKKKYSDQLDNSFSLIIDNSNSQTLENRALMMKRQFSTPRYSFPISDPKKNQRSSAAFVLSEKTASEIFNIKMNKIKNMGEHKGDGVKKFKGFKPVEIQIKAERKYDTLKIDNVLGYVEGTDKKDEFVVISAHYDHLGYNEDKDVYNGADDNASGVAAMMEISRLFNEAKKEGHGPRRSILFIAFTGEEKGLFGSRYYSENPAVPLESTIANLNIDMVGRVDEKNTENPEYIYLIGSDKISIDLHNISEKVNDTYTNLKLDYTFNADSDPNRFYYRSDHYNFARHNIPVIFYFNGAHEDYHQPSDTIEKINFHILEKRTKLIFHTAWELANTENRPSITVNQ